METFEKLEVWREGKKLAVEIYRAFRFCRDFSFRDQIQRAAVSIPANIAEGLERASPAECKHFISFAKGSAGELRTFLYIAEEADLLRSDAAQRLRAKAVQISKQLHHFILSLESRFLPKKTARKPVHPSTSTSCRQVW